MPRNKTTIEDPALNHALGIIAEGASQDVDIFAEYVALASGYKKLIRKFQKTLVISDSYEAQHQDVSKKLEEVTYKYRQLKDVALPICMYCKKIRSDDDYWQQLEAFFLKHADIMFSHGICPDCFKTYFKKMGEPRKKVPDSNVIGIKQRGSQSARTPDEDNALREMRARIRQCAFDGKPLSPDVEQFVVNYGKLLRRFNKTVSISDSYQSQMMELNARLELLTRTDFLTGLANRWDMVTRLELEKHRSERYGKVFSILFADIDSFKRINDTYSHSVGDQVLRAIANTLRTSLRREDVCSRWGGEEFLILLPETDSQTAGSVAEKLLKKVRNTAVPCGDHTIKVTMSIGYGSFSHGMSIDRFITQVDDALHNAKTAGRDRTADAGTLSYDSSVIQ